MGLLRNKEVKLTLLALLLTAAASVGALCLISPAAGGVGTAGFALMTTCYVVSTRARYRQIACLSATLKRVNGGDYTLAPDENAEGELSILNSEIYKVTSTLKMQNESLKKEKLSLAASISDISHQLKTPLTSLFMMTELLYGETLLPEKRREFTAAIHGQLERMQWLVESLLKISKLDADAVAMRPRATPPDVLVQRARAPLNIPMELRGQSLLVEENGLSGVLCDPVWTTEALINILKNCIEYTPQGGSIRLSFSRTALYTQIAVADTGPGIAETDLPHIFERFYKGKNAGPESVGIGLAMAKSIMEAQGGSLTAANGPQGAVFTLRFPHQETI